MLAMAGVLFVALIPPGSGQDWFWQADKLRHAMAFLALWGMGRRARIRPAWILPAGLLIFGIGIELLQSLTPDRQASAADVVADLAGIAAGRLLLGVP